MGHIRKNASTLGSGCRMAPAHNFPSTYCGYHLWQRWGRSGFRLGYCISTGQEWGTNGPSKLVIACSTLLTPQEFLLKQRIWTELWSRISFFWRILSWTQSLSSQVDGGWSAVAWAIALFDPAFSFVGGWGEEGVLGRVYQSCALSALVDCMMTPRLRQMSNLRWFYMIFMRPIYSGAS